MSSPDQPSPPKHSSSWKPRYSYLGHGNNELHAPRPLGLPALLKQSASSASLLSLGRRASIDWDEEAMRGRASPMDHAEHRLSFSEGAKALMTPQIRSQRLIGNSNPRYSWSRYLKSDDELKAMKPGLRQYYEKTNSLCFRFMYIDRLLDSSIPHNLIQEYERRENGVDIPQTIEEEPTPISPPHPSSSSAGLSQLASGQASPTRVKRTQRGLFTVPDEATPLLEESEDLHQDDPLWQKAREEAGADGEGDERIVQIALYVNLAANTILLIGKILVTVLTSSLSVLASLVDAALDFLSTAIIWTTTWMMSIRDPYAYPVGRSRLEPIGVLVFSVIMITSFFQVSIESFQVLIGPDHKLVELTLPAIIIMASTVVIKFACWLWCRLIKNSGVQALAQDAMTDVVFNIFSIIFPLVGFYAKVWWLDALGGLLLSLYVMFNWSGTSVAHIRNLTGAAASADDRNFLLYLTMRFAKTIKQIQGLQAYHAGDKLIVEVDIVLDENISLRDAHDLGESLQYVLESVPTVDRAFVHLDYASYNLPTHMTRDE